MITKKQMLNLALVLCLSSGYAYALQRHTFSKPPVSQSLVVATPTPSISVDLKHEIMFTNKTGQLCVDKFAQPNVSVLGTRCVVPPRSKGLKK